MLPFAHGTTQKRFDLTLAGEINLDLILYGLPQDLPLEREMLASDARLTLGSSSAILAHNLAVLGASVGFATRVGKDPLGQLALDRLAEGGLTVTCTTSEATSTGLTVLLPHGNARRILTYPGTMAELTCEQLDREFLSAGRHFHLSSLFLQTGLHPGLPSLLRYLKDQGMTLSLDTNDDPADVWGGVLDDVLPYFDLVLPNEGELRRMAHTDSFDTALQRIGAVVPTVVVKRGAQGALIFRDGIRTEVASVQVEPVDTIGAGDSFDAGFLFAFLQGEDLAGCAAAGNVTGALSTLRAGGTEAFRNRALREEFLRQHWPLAQRTQAEAK